MQSSLYVGLSAQITLERRLETIAHNVANISTAGFRAEDVKFESLLSPNTPEPVSFSSKGGSYLSLAGGELTKSGNPLDAAVKGDGWFGIETPAGTAYTRDGRFQMTAAGELQTLNGYAVLDAGGAPIQLNPNGGPPAIAGDGTIAQSGRQAGAIGLFQIDPGAKLARYGNSGVIPDKPAIPTLDFVRNGVVQGYVEQANVNPVGEMSRLIQVQRSFDAVTATMSTAETSFREAIRNLGGTG